MALIHFTSQLYILCCFLYWIQCIRVHHWTCGPSFRAQKWLKSIYFVKIDGLRSKICILNDFDQLYWSIVYYLLLFYWIQCIRVPQWSCGPWFRAQKWLKSVYFVKIDGSRSKNLYLNWLWSTLLVNCTSFVAFLLNSVHTGTSMVLWTLI